MAAKIFTRKFHHTMFLLRPTTPPPPRSRFSFLDVETALQHVDRLSKFIGPYFGVLSAFLYTKNKEMSDQKHKADAEQQRVLKSHENTIRMLIPVLEQITRAFKDGWSDARVLKNKERVMEDISMLDLQMMEKVKLGHKICQNDVLVYTFLAASFDEKEKIAKAMLDD